MSRTPALSSPSPSSPIPLSTDYTDSDDGMKFTAAVASNSRQRAPYVPTDEELDARMARDMQLAEELAAKEEAKAMRRRRRSKHSREDRRDEYGNDHQYDGFHTDRLNADHMLFVNCRLDGNDIDVLVDTGASSSAMSKDMVYALGLDHKMNKSVFGDAKGVGSTNIIGVLENVSMRISHIEFRVFFMVIDSQMPCCILGLDQMRRFKCLVDLNEECLVFGGLGGVTVPFLPQDRAMLVAQQMIESAKVADEHAKAREREEKAARRERERRHRQQQQHGSSFDSEEDDDYSTGSSADGNGGLGGAIKRMFRM